MTFRRRRWLAVALAATAFAGILIHPGVYWSIYGRARGEPFWNGRPSAYWKKQIVALNFKAGALHEQRISAIWPRPAGSQPAFLRIGSPPTCGHIGSMLAWLGRQTGCRFIPGGLDVLGAKSGRDPSALPLLLELLGDQDASIRAFAIEGLCHLGQLHPETSAEVIHALRKMQDDAAEVEGMTPPPTVGEMAREAVPWIENGRPGKGYRFD